MITPIKAEENEVSALAMVAEENEISALTDSDERILIFKNPNPSDSFVVCGTIRPTPENLIQLSDFIRKSRTRIRKILIE